MGPFLFHPLWARIFWFSYVTWALFEMWVWSRDRRAAQGQNQDGGSLFFVFGCIFLAIATIFTAPFFAPFARLRLPPVPTFATVMTLMWGGLALRLWAIQTLGRFFRYTVFVHDEHRLVTSGPYRVLRHPSYTGALLTITGFALAMQNWVSLCGGGCFVLLAYSWRVRVEERALQERFGATFEENRARTWAIIPFIW